MPNLGGPELIILLVIVLLLFGAKRIPDLAKSLGSGVREFRRGTSGAEDHDEVGSENKTEEELSSGKNGAGSDTINARKAEEAEQAQEEEESQWSEQSEQSEQRN